MANSDSTTIIVNGADGPTNEGAPHPASSDYVEKRGGKIGKTKWTVSSVACLCTFAAACVGIALIITSALASQDSSPMGATTTPTLPANDVKSAQNAWIQLVTATGEDDANSNGGLPSSVSESVLVNGPASPQAKALRWLALNVASAAAAAPAAGTVTNTNLPLSERYALAVLYFHWSGHMWNIPSDDWIPADMHEQYLQTSNECTWAGITCNEDLSTVTAINMTDHTIFLSALARTTLPSELGLLTGLEHLLIPDNNLQGSAQPLSTLTNLIELDLSQNQLTSAIPYLVYLEEVEVVKLGYNLLQDVVQDRTGLRKLRHIRHFDIQQNPNLTCTSENSFMEYIATGWQKLEELYLSHTNLYFKFPHHAPFIVWPKFAVLRASDTQLDGSIQYTINELTHLRELDLSSPTGSSGLVGDVHPALGGLTSLELLDLDGNAFDSTIPSELGNLKMLKELNLQNNAGIIGSLPTELGLLTNLEILDLSTTNLSGTIPSELGQCTKLYFAEVEFTGLTGSFPSEVCALPWEHLWADCPQAQGGIMVNVQDSIACDCCTDCFGY